jgi:hypothetical protein
MTVTVIVTVIIAGLMPIMFGGCTGSENGDWIHARGFDTLKSPVIGE